MKYIVLHQTDGEPVHVEQVTQEELLKRLNDFYYGDAPTVLDHLPTCRDGCLRELGLVILEAKVVVPKAVQTVVKYEL